MTAGGSTDNFYGKYRGKVEDNVDPKKKGQVLVSVPAVLGSNGRSWAMPCVPYAGKGVGLFAIPPKGTNVWVEFEGGDPDYPIWTGCFWGDGELPSTAKAPDVKVLKTEECSITLDDSSGKAKIAIETKAGMKIIIDSNGIEIDDGKNGSIKLSGPKVSINGNALEVT
ncbi:MAG TPA: phage baseplate assembly protein V [Methanosarcina sp.]|nr:phage baseplate assembly protein V [Methanosarcina sp.]